MIRQCVGALLALISPLAQAMGGAEIEALLALGHERPDAALMQLARWAPADAAGRSEQATVRAWILADNGRENEALRAARDLRTGQEGAAEAASELAQAHLFQTLGRTNDAANAAQAAVSGFDAACVTVCNLRWRWRAELLAASTKAAIGQIESARLHATNAREHAAQSGDTAALAVAEMSLGLWFARAGDATAANTQLALSKRTAGPDAPASLRARLANLEGVVAQTLGDFGAAGQALSLGLSIAQGADLHRQAAVLRVNLADLALRQRRPADALALAQSARPVLRQHGDRRRERVLLHNSGLAHLALGDTGRGRADLDAALNLWQRAGARGELLPALREYADALAAAGDYAGALAMHHRERDLDQELRRANREVALAELQVRYQKDEQQRDIELRRSEGELRKLQLANQTMHQRIWALVAGLAALGLALSATLLRRLWLTRRDLNARQATLRDQSERDPLTGLANRRHIQTLLGQIPTPAAGFQGALLIIDIDHFKQVNDRCGHAGGDDVLKTVADRLSTCLQDHGLAARWGGEEFLVWLPTASAESTQATAMAMLTAVAGTPIVLEVGDPLRVTVSIGCAAFPLPPHHAMLSWEQAVNLVDMALYLAKSQGRNQAVAINSAEAPEGAAWSSIASDFELAEQQGRVRLTRLNGPVVRQADAQAAQATQPTQPA